MKLLLTAFLDAPEMWISALKDVYLKMQESHKSVFEVVWTPRVWNRNTWEEYEGAAANAPWPMEPNPLSISSQIHARDPAVVVVDGKGSICREDALPMIERWGVESYPFSQSREEELSKAEWEAFKVNSQSALEFLSKCCSIPLKNLIREREAAGAELQGITSEGEKHNQKRLDAEDYYQEKLMELEKFRYCRPYCCIVQATSR